MFPEFQEKRFTGTSIVSLLDHLDNANNNPIPPKSEIGTSSLYCEFAGDQ
jgi:hypothetical protein